MGKILLVRQYRKAIEAHTLEIPAGKLDHDGESPLEAAKRELEEEAQLSANEWKKVVDLVPTPGYCNEKFIFMKQRNSAFRKCSTIR